LKYNQMKQSQLLSALNLNIDLNQLSKNVRRISSKGEIERENTLTKADKIIPDYVKKANELATDLCYDRGFCKNSGIDYSQPDIKLIRTAIADYLLNNNF